MKCRNVRIDHRNAVIELSERYAQVVVLAAGLHFQGRHPLGDFTRSIQIADRVFQIDPPRSDDLWQTS